MNLVLKVGGMKCSSCVDKVEKFIGELEGVGYVGVNLQIGDIEVEYNPPATKEQIQEAIEDAGYELL